MAGWIPTSLRRALGADLDSIGPDELDGLIGFEEGQELEFKATSLPKPVDMASDIAQFANGSGGLIVLGIDEDSGRASSIAPIATSVDVPNFVDQVVAAHVQPAPTFSCKTVQQGSGDVWVIGVPPSGLAPHGIWDQKQSARFPIRAGRTKRYLGESELSDRYAKRLRTASEILDRLDEHLAVGHSFISDLDNDSTQRFAWLTLALVPDQVGRLELRAGVSDETKGWLPAAARAFPTPHRDLGRTVFPVFQALQFTDSFEEDPLYSVGGRLWLDGSGVVVLGMPGDHLDQTPPTTALYEWQLIGELVNALSILSTHATRAGAAGSANVACTLIGRPAPLRVWRPRAIPFELELGNVASTEAVGPVIGSGSIDELATNDIDRLGFSRHLAIQLLSAFGLEDVGAVDADLSIQLADVHHWAHAGIRTWADERSISYQ